MDKLKANEMMLVTTTYAVMVKTFLSIVPLYSKGLILAQD